MAKMHLDRLKRRYGYTGGRLRDLTEKILAHNNETIARRIAELRKADWEKAAAKTGPREKRFVVPDVSSVLPRRSVFAVKAAQNGRLITDRLRTALASDLHDALSEFTPKTGESRYLRRRGALAGTVNPKLVSEFEARIRETFADYRRRDPRIGMPGNVHGIAVTEFRGTVESVKREFMAGLKSRNPGMTVRKTWLQNKSLAKQPRHSHGAVNGKTIGVDELFEVPVYKFIRGRWFKTGTVVRMTGPHDPQAPASEVVTCNCELVYSVVYVRG